MKNPPLVSVIIPNYNHAPYLVERIESVLNQTFQDFELIILDDCSPDNSHEVIARYAQHPRVSQVVFNEQNSGNTFFQWDKGIKLAKGKYVWIAESDDVADEHFLEATVSAIESYPHAVMCLTGSHLIDQNSQRMKRKTRDRWRETGEAKAFPGVEYVRHNLMYRNYVYNASMVIFKREVYEKIDKSFQQLRCAGDWQFWAEVAMQGDVVEVRSKLNRFRQHTNKVSSRAAKTGQGVSESIDVRSYLLKRIPVSDYKRWMIQGDCFKMINRLKVQPEIKIKLFEKGRKQMQIEAWHFYLSKFNRILSFIFPFLPNHRGDKLK